MLIVGNVPPTPTEMEKPEFDLDSEMARIQKRGTLSVAVLADYEGFSAKSSRTGEFVGFNVDLASVIAQAIFGGTTSNARKHVNLVTTTISQCDTLIRERSVDLVLANYADTPDRRKFARFAGHYLFTPQAPMLGPKSPSVLSMSDLNGLRVGAISNSVPLATLPTLEPGVEMVEFPVLDPAMKSLRTGDIQAFFCDVASNRMLMKYEEREMTMAAVRYEGERWAFAMSKDVNDLGDFVDEVVHRSVESGALNASMQRWLS